MVCLRTSDFLTPIRATTEKSTNPELPGSGSRFMDFFLNQSFKLSAENSPICGFSHKACLNNRNCSLESEILFFSMLLVSLLTDVYKPGNPGSSFIFLGSDWLNPNERQ